MLVCAFWMYVSAFSMWNCHEREVATCLFIEMRLDNMRQWLTAFFFLCVFFFVTLFPL